MIKEVCNNSTFSSLFICFYTTFNVFIECFAKVFTLLVDFVLYRKFYSFLVSILKNLKDFSKIGREFNW